MSLPNRKATAASLRCVVCLPCVGAAPPMPIADSESDSESESESDSESESESDSESESESDSESESELRIGGPQNHPSASDCALGIRRPTLATRARSRQPAKPGGGTR